MAKLSLVPVNIFLFTLVWCYHCLMSSPSKLSSILKEISPEYPLKELMLKLKLQYFGHLMRRADCFEKTLMLGKIEGRRRRDDRGWDCWMASPTQWTWVWVDSGSWWWTGRPGMLWSMRSWRVGHDWATELSKLTICSTSCCFCPSNGHHNNSLHTWI